ncbi:glycosyltransferase family 2 protein [Vibrio kasasachensis]|uniref:glycosyltransferase family 2 protein n=1 Tax=Vibrio kasasachensis TaxID=2910248 RepID=UPI003D0BC6EF
MKTIKDLTGWLFLFCFILGLASLMPQSVFSSDHQDFILIIGAIGIWRYSIGFIHFIRGWIFLFLVFPFQRKRAVKALSGQPPSHIYLMVTSFRIDAITTAKVYRSIIEEAIVSKYPTTIVASIVEQCDEQIMAALWEELSPPEDRVSLRMVRIPGTGKRDGLAHGFRAISRDIPDETALVAVVDGDTILQPGCVAKSIGYFSLYPNVGALTTNEVCEVEGSYWMSQWHKLRFAQRHISMCSMALSKRVLTMTGRMSMFRASVVTSHHFIDDVENDHLKHWRLGTFKFLTGDDKSSWFSMMKQGWDTFYVPDAIIETVEHPPNKSFFKSAKQLMFRWYGNNLRQNARATSLGARRLGFFTYYVIWDQRISMWTSILGLSAATYAAFKYHIGYLVVYILWISITRTFITLLLLTSGHKIGPTYPLMLYFNQIFGALIKIYVVFRLNRQSWTRQKTTLTQVDASFQARFTKWSTRIATFSAVSIFAAVIVTLV